MTGPISFGNDRSIGRGATGTQLDIHAGKVDIRMIPENAFGNDISKCINIRDTGTGALYPIATATSPQEFDLPLAAGIDTYGKSTYWKTQEGICFVNIAAHSPSDGIMDQSIIATLPAGFRPDMVTYAAGHGFTNAGTRIPLDVGVNPDGTIQIWVASALEYCSCFVGFVAAS